MNETEFKLRAIVVVGWTMMLMVLLAMFVVDLAASAIAGNFGNWAFDMSHDALMIMLVIMSIYVFVPMLTLIVSARWFRYLVVILAVLATLFFIAHEIAHFLKGDMPFGIRHVLDLSHHVLGVLVAVAASKWAAMPAGSKLASVTSASLKGEAA